jgi:hypothetical protein
MSDNAEFRQDAIAYTPEMFRRLCEALRRHSSEHVAAGLAAKDEGGSFQVRRSAYPTLFLQIQAQRGFISYVAVQRKAASGRDSRNEGAIVIVCAGQDQFYYRLDGDDIASEAQLAEHLLARLF